MADEQKFPSLSRAGLDRRGTMSEPRFLQISSRPGAPRSLHNTDPFTPELLDRWLEIFHDTVDGGWAGPDARRAKQRATGMAWAMAQRSLGKGNWRPAQHR